MKFILHINEGEGKSAELELIEPIHFKNTDTGKEWVIPSGFKTDGNSVPRPFTAMFLHFDESTLAALAHDFDCEQYKTHQGRIIGDIDFLRNMKFVGVPWGHRWAKYLGVSLMTLWLAIKGNLS